jgi:hypothetical protein
MANADTGSDIGLMSLAHVQKRGFALSKVELESFTLQFADATIAFIIGKVNVRIGLGLCEDLRSSNIFHVLEDLTCEVLLSKEYLYENNAFEIYSEAFSYNDCKDDAVDFNAIMWVNIEKE